MNRSDDLTQDAPLPQTLYRIPRELGKPVLLDAPLHIKHIAFASLVRFIKWGSRFRLPACLRSYELFR